MLILSVGMPRAGSGWFYNLMHDLVVVNGGTDARLIRQRFHLNRIWSEVNCNIGVLSLRRLILSMLPALMGYTYVIKAHAAPSLTAIRLMKLGWLRAAYIYRDPRDAMLSALENGQRARQKGRANAFSELVDFEHALAFMQEYVQISQAWLALPHVLKVRYEDLVNSYDRETEKLSAFLGVNQGSQQTQAVLDRYRPAQATAEQKGLHFRKGISGRYRQVFTQTEQEILNRTFGDYLIKNGYQVERDLPAG